MARSVPVKGRGFTHPIGGFEEILIGDEVIPVEKLIEAWDNRNQPVENYFHWCECHLTMTYHPCCDLIYD